MAPNSSSKDYAHSTEFLNFKSQQKTTNKHQIELSKSYSKKKKTTKPIDYNF